MSVAVAARSSGASTKGKNGLAWISYGSGAVGGSALASTFVGGWIGDLCALASKFTTVLVVLMLVGMFVDLLIDRTPNRLAVWVSILLPSMAQGVDGQVGAGIRSVATGITQHAQALTTEWFGIASMLGLAALGISIALLVARRVVKKGGG